MSYFGFPRSLSRGLSASASLRQSVRYGLLSSGKTLKSAKTTSRLTLKKSSTVTESQKSSAGSSLGQSFLDQIKDQASQDAKAGVSLEEGRKKLLENSPLLKLLSTTNASQFQKSIGSVYDTAYQEAKAEKASETASSQSGFDVKV